MTKVPLGTLFFYHYGTPLLNMTNFYRKFNNKTLKLFYFHKIFAIFVILSKLVN